MLVVSSYSGVSGQRPSMLQSQLRVTELSKRYSISGTFCYRVHFGTGEIFLQGTFCCKGHFVTRDILLQGTFCFRGHCVLGLQYPCISRNSLNSLYSACLLYSLLTNLKCVICDCVSRMISGMFISTHTNPKF